MSLPVPDLDDRDFQQIVDEAKRMIPQLVPEWTNHNVSDPGVALIELFAWMSEQVIFRLNQVPEKLYVEFLNLLGTTPFPASSARVPITFWLAAAPNVPISVPRGTEVTTELGGVVFATSEELRIVQPTLTAALTSVNEGTYLNVLPELQYDRDSLVCFSSQPVAPGDAFNLGFDVSLAGQMVVLQIDTAGRGIGVDPDDVPLAWEAWSGEHWLPTHVVQDTTGGLNRSGTLRLVVPAAHEPLVINGSRGHWLRVRLTRPRSDQATFLTSPKIAKVEVSCLGGTVMAEHAVVVGEEAVGTSDGTPHQRFALRHQPVLPRREGEQVLVTMDGEQQAWDEVADFGNSQSADRHVVFDEALGSIQFGPSVRYPDGKTIQHGAVPPFGAQISLTSYRTGGGTVGNVATRSLTVLRSSVAYVDAVANLEPARGGVDPEGVDEVKVRGPRTLRTGRRAVTASDYEQLTLESTPRVARALCLPPSAVHEPIVVLVVPGSTRAPETFELDDFALSQDLYATVARHLDERRTLGAAVRVTAPYYQGISVVARVRAVAGRSPLAVKERVGAAIARYLSPITGGAHGEGWPFGVEVNSAGLTVLIEDVPGVSAVDEIALFELDLRNGTRLGDPVQAISLDKAALFLSGRTQVVVR
ncbi:MAG: putative phage baseplate assembly protein [Glaciecola sp.]|jgi:predicted phage baseplate assembly protein